MKTFICLLRGINVSGHNIIKMDALRGMYEALAFKNVQTYIQSGNVIFKSDQTDCSQIENKISKKLLQEFSIQVPVMVKELAELKAVAKNSPFANKRKEDPKSLHVTFLSNEPDKGAISALKGGVYTPDEFILSGKTVYLFCPEGYGNTKLTNTFFEKKLKVVATTRNWKTVHELINIAQRITDGSSQK